MRGNLLPKLFDGVSEVLHGDVVLVDGAHSIVGCIVVVLLPACQVASLICVHTVTCIPVIVACPPWHVCRQAVRSNIRADIEDLKGFNMV
jgi:hypothetical protein